MSLALWVSLPVRDDASGELPGVGAGSGAGEGRCAWCPRSHPKDCAGSMEDILKELLQHRAPQALQQYLRKVRVQAGEGLLYLLTAWC